MKIYGIDFTSAPNPRKQITCAECGFEDDDLHLEISQNLASFDAFEAFLRQAGPWLAGMDFPFGQPRKLIENLGWPKTWEGYVSYISGLSKPEFVELLRMYRSTRPEGDKQHLRITDQMANSRSPMMLYGIPVGKMFFEGAPRLLASGGSIQPCRPNNDPRIIIEAYPALVARRWIGNRSYKNDEPRKQTSALQTARKEIIQGLRSNTRACYGFYVHFSDAWADAAIQDGTGDQLDAFLCAVQAGWAYVHKDENFGIPTDCDPLEGWIVDPYL